MRKRNLLIVVIAAALAISGAQLPNVVSANNGAGAATEAPQKKKGNRFANALSAPFRALGKLFGGGGSKREKKDETASEALESKKLEKQANATKQDGKPRRVTKKDVAAFESAVMMRVSNNTVAPAEPSAPSVAPPSALIAQARALIARQEFGEAISLLSGVAANVPDLAQAHHLLGYAYDRRGLRQLSCEAYERALKIAPNDAQLLNDYGYTLYLRGQHKEAKDLLKKAARLSPNDERIWNNLAAAQFKLEKFDDAYKSFARAGGEFKGRMNVAGMLERIGRDKDALKHYEAARQLNPSSRPVLQHLVDVYQRLGRLNDAEAARQSLGVAGPQDRLKIANGGQ